MKTLYLDTSSSFLYCGLVDDNNLVFEVKKLLGKDMSKCSLITIKQKFDEFNISVDSVDKIILVNGPGSFTGIRIGATIAKTYAWAKKIPITTITSLEAIALSCTVNTDLIVPIIDARRGFVFGQIFDNNFSPVTEPKYISLDVLKDKVSEISSFVTYISNDIFEFDTEKYSPDILKIVTQYKDKEPVNPHSIDAFYLKLTEAEEKANVN